MKMDELQVWMFEEFEVKLCVKSVSYYIYYFFQVMMYEGKCSCEQFQVWVVNCYYYQISILIKDVVIMFNCLDCEVCWYWVQCIFDYDGYGGEDGGIEVWICFGEVVGLSCEDIVLQKLVLFGVCFVVDVYINFVWCSLWQEVVVLLLIELFVLIIYKFCFDYWLIYYLWIELEGYDYFQCCLIEVLCDVINGLCIMFGYFNICELQERVFDILQFKFDLLWLMFDLMLFVYCLVYIEGWGVYMLMNKVL